MIASFAPLTDFVSEPDRPEVQQLKTVVEQVRRESEGWTDELLVTISRAKEIVGLRESQIRYYEELGALQPVTTSGRAGANRLYSIHDLRRLRTLAILSEERKAAEAAELVQQYATFIDDPPPLSLAAALHQERNAVADGFFLTRIISQLIAAIETEIERRFQRHGSHATMPQIVGLIYPGRALFPSATPSIADVAACAEALRQAPAGALVALCPPDDEPDPRVWAPELLETTGSDAQTLLFYSRESRPIVDLVGHCFAAYVPAHAPEQNVLIAFRNMLPDAAEAPLAPTTLEAGRSFVLDQLLALTDAIFRDFRQSAQGRNYRYRSDGFPLSLTRDSYAQMLKHIAGVIFPGDDTAMAVLQVPDGLDQPQSLTILAHFGYEDYLLARAKIALKGEGQGLSGRAYCSGEPFVSLDAAADRRRVQYAHEEDCKVALAVPLAATWGIVPFGVLYLASRRDDQTLASATIFSALIVGDILSELLGRWWLTRLRRQQDIRLHRQLTTMLTWLDSLDSHGPGFQRGLAAIMKIAEDVAAQFSPEHLPPKHAYVALAVLDIEHYRETIQSRSNDPFPVYAQLHVRQAIQRVLSADFTQCYWFGNDHALLVLEDHGEAKAQDVIDRIVEQVADSPVPLPGRNGPKIFITVQPALKVVSLRSLYDLGRAGIDNLRHQVTALIDLLREQAGKAESPR
ncbi:MAG: MerR family transcriptional regulator [Oscillochloris sp.]|nr:MerR family transcriptional regulator [Oscillochloris sp.]